MSERFVKRPTRRLFQKRFCGLIRGKLRDVILLPPPILTESERSVKRPTRRLFHKRFRGLIRGKLRDVILLPPPVLTELEHEEIQALIATIEKERQERLIGNQKLDLSNLPLMQAAGMPAKRK